MGLSILIHKISIIPNWKHWVVFPDTDLVDFFSMRSSESILIPRYFTESTCDNKDPPLHVIESIF